MAINQDVYQKIKSELDAKAVTLVAVSKTKPVEDILALYKLGQRDFGENYVQELVDKASQLPGDIRWHFIGHLQSNKVKYIAPFTHLIHGVDSLKLLNEINKQADKNNRIIDCLLQVHIAQEETKFGFSEIELSAAIAQLAASEMKHVRIMGLMGMASLTDNLAIVRTEFKYLKSLLDLYSNSSTYNLPFTTLSMGMSSDYTIAMEEKSNLVRIGSLLFGKR